MNQTIQKHIIPVSVIIGLVILLWLPFGLNTTIGGLEEWTDLKSLQNGENMLFMPERNPTRPLNFAPYTVPALLMPDDVFTGYNLVLIGIFISKALLVYALLRLLIPQNPYIALVTAILFMIYPADLGLFSFRALPNQTTVVAALLSLFLLVYHWQKPRRLLWIAIWAAQLMCLLIYEQLYPVLFAAPLLLLWMDRRVTRRFWRVTLLWSIIPALLFAWVAWKLVNASPSDSYTYVGTRLAEAQTLGATGIKAMLKRIPPLYIRHVSEWIYTATELVGRSPHLPTASLAGLMVGAASWRFARRSRGHSSVFIWVCAGLVMIFLGYAAYLPSSYENVHWRMYLFSSLGAALVVSGIAFWLTQRSAIAAGCVSGVLVMLAMLHSLEQHSIIADSSIYLQRMLGSIVQQAPQIDPDAVVVLIDDEAAIAQSDWRLSGYDNALQGALGYIYNNPVQAIFCTEADILGDPSGRRVCRWQADGVYRLFGGVESLYPYDRLIVFQTQAGGMAEMLAALPPKVTDAPGVVNYHPERLINLSAALPARVSSLFTCWPVETCFPLNSPPQASIRLDFDRIVRGIGWQGGSLDWRQLWMEANRSTIIVNPITDRPLEIQFGVSRSMGEDILDSLALEVNDQPVDIQRIGTDGMVFRGIIPQSALRDETELAFSVARVVSEYHLSVEFDWLEIRPMP